MGSRPARIDSRPPRRGSRRRTVRAAAAPMHDYRLRSTRRRGKDRETILIAETKTLGSPSGYNSPRTPEILQGRYGVRRLPGVGFGRPMVDSADRQSPPAASAFGENLLSAPNQPIRRTACARLATANSPRSAGPLPLSRAHQGSRSASPARAAGGGLAALTDRRREERLRVLSWNSRRTRFLVVRLIWMAP